MMQNHGHNGVTVFGGPKAKAGRRGRASVQILQGASSRTGGLRPDTPIYDVRGGARLLVRDIWYEGQGQTYLQLTDSGDFVQCGNRIAPYALAADSGRNAIMMAGQSGQVVLAQCAPHGADSTIGRLGEGFQVTLMGLTPYGGSKIRLTESPAPPAFVQVACRNNNTKWTGSEPLADVNGDGDLAERLKILREWKLPPADLDAAVKLHRVSCTGSIGLVIVSSQPGKKKGE